MYNKTLKKSDFAYVITWQYLSHNPAAGSITEENAEN